MTLPAGWTAVQASAAWDGVSGLSSQAAEADKFAGTTAAAAFVVATPTTKRLADVVKQVIQDTITYHSDTCPPEPEAPESIKIGGQPATLLAWNCGILINIAVTVQDGVAYEFGFRDPSVHAATDAADRATLLTLLASVQLP